MDILAFPSSSEVSWIETHKRHSLRGRDSTAAAAGAINPPCKSSLFSSHFKLHGRSAVPCLTPELPHYPQVPSFSVALSTHKCRKSPQSCEKGGSYGEKKKKNQGKYGNWEILPLDVSRQSTDSMCCFTASWKKTYTFFCFSFLPPSSSSDTHMHTHTERKSSWEHFFVVCFVVVIVVVFHCSLTDKKQKIKYPAKLEVTYQRKRVV